MGQIPLGLRWEYLLHWQPVNKLIHDQHNLTPLRSLDIIDNLDGNELVAYLQGYGVSTPPTSATPVATDRLRKEKLKAMVRGIWCDVLVDQGLSQDQK